MILANGSLNDARKSAESPSKMLRAEVLHESPWNPNKKHPLYHSPIVPNKVGPQSPSRRPSDPFAGLPHSRNPQKIYLKPMLNLKQLNQRNHRNQPQATNKEPKYPEIWDVPHDFKLWGVWLEVTVVAICSPASSDDMKSEHGYWDTQA